MVRLVEVLERGSLNLTDMASLGQAIHFSHMRSSILADKLRSYLKEREYELEDFNKFMDLKEGFYIIAGVISLDPNREGDNLDLLFNGYFS